MIQFVCPACGSPFNASAKQIGSVVYCSRCATAFAIPASEPPPRSVLRSLPVLLVGGFGLLSLLVGCVLLVYLAVGSTQGATAYERGLCLAYLRENANDPDSLQVVRWSDPPSRKTADGAVVVYAKVRSKNGFGALMLSVVKFELKAGKVAKVDPLADWPGD